MSRTQLRITAANRSLADILHYHKLNVRIDSSGQPATNPFALTRQAGCHRHQARLRGFGQCH
ncbi:hypothetical protein FE785_03005 [Thiomicrorhabdus sediminis]|uniref:Uncharacterized protein n=1 Tax=Thiomicrorhabdus sediminis TaxID=2580412 RepID=A0A4P9K5Y6_9GAMM|nr:hypothetical protein FE785_03005 [Thiomicrorhabdus sediminis]